MIITKELSKARKRYDESKCDSRAEHEFIHAFVKFSQCNFEHQYPCKTSKGSYRVDFMLEKNGIKYGIEIDGKQHEKTKEYDTVRDEAIIKEEHLNGIIRIPAWLCIYYRFIAVYFVACYLPYDFLNRESLFVYIKSESLYIHHVTANSVYFIDAETKKEFNVECLTKGKISNSRHIPAEISYSKYNHDYPICESCGKRNHIVYENICVDCA